MSLRPFGADGGFRPSESGEGLRLAAVRSAGVTVFSQSFVFAVQMVSTVVLARLLTPADFGVVTMVTTFSLLFMNFGMNGFTEAVVQRDLIDHSLASNLFWLNVGGSLLMAAAFAGAGSLLARFYHDPRVTGVAEAMALTIFLTGLSVLHLALLKRAMKFSAVSINDIFGRVLSVAVAVLLGWAGWGYWALVGGAVALAASTCIGSWMLCRWVPGLPSRHADTLPAIRFAASTYARFSSGYFTSNFDNFLIGWRLGPTPLGFYKKAYDLFILPTNQLSSPLTIVAVSTLSRLRGDLSQYRRYFLRALEVLAFVGMGLGAVLTLVGRDLVLVLLGPKWGESGRIFTFFGPGIGIMLLYFSHQWIHLSIGRADRWLRWGMIDLTLTALFLLVGLHWGAVGIALAWVISCWLVTLPALWYAGRPIQFGIAPMIAVIWKFVVASLLAGCAAFALVREMPLFTAGGAISAFLRVVIASVLFAVLYLAGVILLHRGCEPLHQFAGLLREMISRKTSSPSLPLFDRATGATPVPEAPLLSVPAPESNRA